MKKKVKRLSVLLIILSLLIVSSGSAQVFHMTDKGVSVDSLIRFWGYYPISTIAESLRKSKCDYTVTKSTKSKGTTTIVVRNATLCGYPIPAFSIIHLDSKDTKKKKHYKSYSISFDISHKEWETISKDTNIINPFLTLFKIGIKEFGKPLGECTEAKAYCRASIEERKAMVKELFNYDELEVERPRILAMWNSSASYRDGSEGSNFSIKIDAEKFMSVHFYNYASITL